MLPTLHIAPCPSYVTRHASTLPSSSPSHSLSSTAQLEAVAGALPRWATTLREVDISHQPLQLPSPLLSALATAGLRELTSLRLASCRVGPLAAGALASALPQLPQLTSLDLGDCALGSEGAAALAAARAAAWGQLRYLNLSRNGIADGANLGDGLRSARRLAELRLEGNELSGSGFEALCEALAAPCATGDEGDGEDGGGSTLRVLNLSSNPLRVSGGHALAEALPRLRALRTLTLFCCELGDAGCAALAVAMRGLPALEVLDLSSNALGDSAADALAKALGDSAVRCLVSRPPTPRVASHPKRAAINLFRRRRAPH